MFGRFLIRGKQDILTYPFFWNRLIRRTAGREHDARGHHEPKRNKSLGAAHSPKRSFD